MRLDWLERIPINIPTLILLLAVGLFIVRLVIGRLGVIPASWRRSLVETLDASIFAALLSLVIITFVVQAFYIPSGSMENTLLVGDFLLANKFIYGSKVPLIDVHLPAVREPKPGDVIIFKFPLNPKQNYIKRLIATPGQTVEIRNKNVYLDGKLFPLPQNGKFTDQNLTPGRDDFGPVTVPPGKLFVMGDNRDNSYDSRFWGFLDRKLVLGKAMILHWSWKPEGGDTGSLQSAQYPHQRQNKADRGIVEKVVSKIGSLAYDIVRIPWKVRWERVGDLIR